MHHSFDRDDLVLVKFGSQPVSTKTMSAVSDPLQDTKYLICMRATIGGAASTALYLINDPAVTEIFRDRIYRVFLNDVGVSDSHDSGCIPVMILTILICLSAA